MRGMLKWGLLTLLLLGSAMVIGGTVKADNGPHMGDFNPTTDACAGCHRAHRGQTDSLLVQASQTNLCYTCHAGGTGALTDVMNGVYLGGSGGGLRAGGFTSAIMDADLDGTPTSGAVTSSHSVGMPGTMWGNGTASVGQANVTLQCGSCHNPHGFSAGGADPANVYRILLPQPRKSNATGNVWVTEELIHSYTTSYQPGSNFRDDSYLDNRGMSQWCSQCHTRYMAASTADSGDTNFKNRHAINETDRKCTDCHVAHGTSATMTPQLAGSVEWPDGTPGGGGADSRLLTVNNRGVCFQCHASP